MSFVSDRKETLCLAAGDNFTPTEFKSTLIKIIQWNKLEMKNKKTATAAAASSNSIHETAVK